MSTSPQMPESSDNQAKKRQAKEKLIFAPRRVLDDPNFQPPPGEKPDSSVKLERDDIHTKAFETLGLLEESAQKKSLRAKKQASRDLAMSVIDDPDAYLEQLERAESAESDEAQAAEETDELGESFDVLLDQEIAKLLAMPQVSKLLKSEISKELARYALVEDKLKRLRTLRYAIKRATLDMHATYLRSKRENTGTLLESAGKRIEGLHRVVAKAETERDSSIAQASSIDRGFINTQELIRYKRQIKEAGFALTPSREKLLQRIVEHAMAGHKVFLVGSTGTGKTELAFYALNETTGDYEIIPWHEGTVIKDILGQNQISKTEDGTVQSQFKPGPLARAMEKGKGALHEEVTSGSTRTMLGLKPFWNLKPGQLVRIPEMNGDAFCVDSSFIELFTGNPKSEQTKEREDLDPAILRMLKGVHVQYMPAAELTKIVVAQIMDESGLVKLTKSDVEIIRHLAEAAELMQQCHENILTPEQQTELKAACGIDDLRLQKNFLDPGTFFGLFARWDYERRKGKTFRQYLAEQLHEFVNDPKSLGIPEEKKILLGILKIKKCVDRSSTEGAVTIAEPEKYEKPYILPSEMAVLDGVRAQIDDDPLADNAPPDEKDPAAEEPTPPDAAPDDTEIDRVIDERQNSIFDMLARNNPGVSPDATGTGVNIADPDAAAEKLQNDILDLVRISAGAPIGDPTSTIDDRITDPKLIDNTKIPTSERRKRKE